MRIDINNVKVFFLLSYRNENLGVHHWQCGIEFVMKISAQHSRYHKMDQNQETSIFRRNHVPNKMNDNWLVKIAKNGKPDTLMAKVWCENWTLTSQENRHIG